MTDFYLINNYFYEIRKIRKINHKKKENFKCF